jgi:predicted DNA-binding transcriptional regulator YafY
LERLIRLLRIIYLIQSAPGIKARELAEICETSERTIYRDIEVISAANLPIRNQGHNTGYDFIGNFKLYPLDWDKNEFTAFTMIPALLGKEYQTPAFLSAYEKVMATHHAEKAARKTFLSELTKVIQGGRPSATTLETNQLPTIIEAILSLRTIEAVYHTQSRDETTQRKIDPYYLIPRDNRLYVMGYCHSTNDIRTFRLSRFHHVEILEQTFTKDDLNMQRYLEHTWSIIRGQERIHFKVLFSKNVARYIKEEEFIVTPKLTEQKDGSLRLEVILNDDREFLKWVMQYGPDAEIIEPKKYRIKMKELLRSWIELYPE